MVTVSVREAESQLANLVQRVAEGEEVVLTQDDSPVARIVKSDELPIAKVHSKRVRHPGNARGVVLHMSDDFDAPVEDFKDYM